MLLSRNSGCKGTNKSEKVKMKSEKFAAAFALFNFKATANFHYSFGAKRV
jgi:hypothetical protein